MKKLLFTLCAVLAGFAANAGSLDVKYVYDDGTPVENNEVVVKPGESLTLHINVTNLNGIVEGAQFQWFMRDQAGAAMLPNGNVALQNYDGYRFVAEGMTTIKGNEPAQTMANVNGERAYRIIDTNTGYGTMWTTSKQHIANVLTQKEGYDISVDEIGGYGFTDAMFTEGNVFLLTITTKEAWADDYATFVFDSDYDKLSWRGEAAGKLGLPDLKILNENKIPKTLTGEIVISEPDENGQVTVTYTGNEDVTITVNGQPYTGPIQLEDGVETTIDVTVSADGYKDLTGSATYTWTAPTPDQTAAPVITYTAENGTLTVTATGAQGDAIILNGPNNEKATGTTTASYDVTYDPYVGYTGTWTATAQADGELVSVVAEKPITVAAITPTVAKPVITFAETKEGDVVTAVTVQIENWTSATINGEEFTNTRDDVKTFTANYTADQVITVNAVNAPIEGHPEFKATAEDTYTLKKLEKKNVPAPEVTPQTGDDAVTLNITWPVSDGTHVIKVNGQETTNTEFPRQDADYTVELDVYVTAGATCNESTHYTQTITIPKKVTTPTEQTGQPTFKSTTKPNHNALYITIDNAETEPNATIYYQITYPDGTKSGWLEYTPGQEIAIFGPNEGGQQGTHLVEAYAVAPGKLPSETIKLEPSLGPTTGIDELIDGKAIANVRYFNMAGQEMQEANGMTIVVTTYTDGTTSAVKVMK